MDEHGDPNGAGQAAHAETFELSPCREENGHATHSGGRGTPQESTSRSLPRKKLPQSRDASSKTQSPTPAPRIGCRRRSVGRGAAERGRPGPACMSRKEFPRSFAVHAKPHHVPTLPSKPSLTFLGRIIQSFR